MSRYDVAVIGLGGAGLACLSRLSRRGLRLVGLDRHQAAGPGCSSRSYRGFRQAYFVDDLYVRLARRAYLLWKELDAEDSEPLLEITGALQIGPPDHRAVSGVLSSCRRNDLPAEVLDTGEACTRYPVLRADGIESSSVVLEERAGILNAARCNRVLLQQVVDAGIRLIEDVAVLSIQSNGRSVSLVTGNGETIDAEYLVLSPGYGIHDVLAAVQGSSWRPDLRVQEQAELYFDVRGVAAYRELPPFSFITPQGPYSLVPPRGGEGLKVFRQHPPVPADNDPELRAFLAETLVGGEEFELCGRHVNREAITSDRHPLVGQHPEHSRILLVAGLSGHGYKFTPVLGEMIAEQICSGTPPPSLFWPSRFSPGS